MVGVRRFVLFLQCRCVFECDEVSERTAAMTPEILIAPMTGYTGNPG